MDVNDQIARVIGERLSKDSQTGEFKVEVRTGYNQFDLDQKSASSLVMVVKNPLIEDDPEKARQVIMKVLSELEPLKGNVQLETETNHMARLARELEWFRAQEASLNEKTTGTRITTIPDSYPKWFEELPKRSGWNIKHALNVTKDDFGVIKIEISTPKDIDPDIVVKNITNRMAAIKATLADRAAKYSPQQDKDTIKQQVQNLDIAVTSGSNEWGKTVTIEIKSPEQLKDAKLPGGISKEKLATYVAENPLLTLQNGEDDQDRTLGAPQPHLKKTLARSFLFAGENHIEVFPYIAGKEDMRRATSKSLVKLKKRAIDNPSLVDPDLAKKIDEFMADPVFKDLHQWGKPVEKQDDIPHSPRFVKMTGDPGKPYEKGVMEVSIDLPVDKFTDIRQKLAATPTLEQKADQEELIRLADSLIAAGNALTAMTRNVVAAGGVSWTKKEEVRDANNPSHTLGV